MRFRALGLLAYLAASPTFADETLPEHAGDTLLHVIAHEIGHALIREFDLPILGPEEAIADDFATVLIVTAVPGQAERIIANYAIFKAHDASEAPLFSEYTDDVKRGARAVCLAYGYRPDNYGSLADRFGLNGDLAANCRDSAPEVFRSWRRIMAPLMMPQDVPITEVGIRFDDSAIAQQLSQSEVMHTAEQLLARFDWHSRITLSIVSCDGSAGWSRNGRTITVCDDYIARFARAQ